VGMAAMLDWRLANASKFGYGLGQIEEGDAWIAHLSCVAFGVKGLLVAGYFCGSENTVLKDSIW
jgi:hypothetical protein